MHAGDGNVHTNIPVNSNDYEMMHEAERIVDRVMALAVSLDGVISGEHGIGLTKFRFLEPAADGRVRQIQIRGRSARPLQPRQAAGRLRACTGLHALAAIGAAGSLDPRRQRPGRAQRRHQELPALRQVQTGVQHAHPARQSALLAAQQDSRHRPDHRGLPLRGTDPARYLGAPLRRDERRRRPLHRLPQMPESLPGEHRFRRCLDPHARHPAGARQEAQQHRHEDVHGLSQCHRPDHGEADAQGAHRVGLCRPAPGAIVWRGRC